jgi:hypothetical protein
MAILIAPTIVLNDQEFQEEMTKRRQKLNLAKGQAVLGCPLCGFEQLPGAGGPATGRGQVQ